MGGRGYGGGGRGRGYIYRYTVATRMTCLKMGSDESHFNVSLIVRDKATSPCPQTTTFEEKGQPVWPSGKAVGCGYRSANILIKVAETRTALSTLIPLRISLKTLTLRLL